MNTIYRSPLPFSPDPSPALAVFCSDSRFDEHCAKFVAEHLGIATCDLFVVPGGAAWLVWDWHQRAQQRVAKEQIAFLIEAHRLQRIVVIAHDDCGFYKRKHPNLTADERRARQIEDLRIAREEMRAMKATVNVETYFVRVTDGVVDFERVD